MTPSPERGVERWGRRRLRGFLRLEGLRLVLQQLVRRDAEQVAEHGNRIQFQRDDFAIHDVATIRYIADILEKSVQP